METRLTLLTQLPSRWPEFVTVYEPFLLQNVRAAGVRPQDVRDVVQTVFVSLLRKLPGFQYDNRVGRFRGWLRRVVQNAVIDFYRSEAGRRETLKKVATQQEIAPPVVPEFEETSEGSADDVQRQRILTYVLSVVQAETKPLTWNCFSQHLLQGRGAREVADELQVSSNAVYVNASRVLEKIRLRCGELHEVLVE